MISMKPLDIVARIEQMELKLTEWNAIRSLVPSPRQLEVVRRGSSILLRDRSAPDSMYYNRIKGLGPQDLPDIDELLGHYPNGAPCLDITPNHMTEEVSRTLSINGYIPAEQLVFMVAHTSNGCEGAPGFQIKRVTEQDAEEFIRWIERSMDGMEISSEIIERTKAYFYSPHFLNYMIRIDGNPAAMGSLFLHGEEGYIANDYTFEAYRGRGCQMALLKRRLEDAASLGVTDVYTDVVFGSASHNNMEKAGFRTAFLNTFWIKK